MKRLLPLVLSLAILPAWACTGMMLKAKDGTAVNGRTLEFGIDLQPQIVYVPAHYAFKGTLPDGGEGLSYKAKYAVLGANTFGIPAVVDGVNEMGLTVGSFYFPGFAGYSEVKGNNKNKGLSALEYPNWLLTQFATVDEVKEHYHDAIIVPTAPKGWGIVPPMHYVVYDKSGKSVVIEPVNGILMIHDNPLGVVTNSPTFDWHMTNLSNYINLSPMGVAPVEVDGVKFQALGNGSGMQGLPGDFTPPSRFVRAAIFSSTAVTPKNGHDAVLQMFHLLNQFDLPKGAIRNRAGKNVEIEYTSATTVKDPEKLQYFIKTYDDQSIKMADLNTFDKQATELAFLPVKGQQPIVNLTAADSSPVPEPVKPNKTVKISAPKPQPPVQE